MRDYISLYINGKKHEVRGDDVFLPVSRYLREKLGLVGTKVVCSEGDCGACSVLISTSGANSEFLSVNSCISPIYGNDGRHIVTIEGLPNEGKLHPIQDAFVKKNGAQCGFCSPGFIISLSDMFEHHQLVDESKVKNYLTGNLCRCTGYKDIISSALNVDKSRLYSLKKRFITDDFLKEMKVELDNEVKIVGNTTLYSPTTLNDALEFLKDNPKAHIVSSATDIGVLVNKGKVKPDTILNLSLVSEISTIEKKSDYLNVGTGITLRNVQQFCESTHAEFSKFLNYFASPQIKNRATLVGNVANGSPIGDTIPFLSVIEARVVLSSLKGNRKVELSKFYQGYKQFDLLEGELITAVELPLIAEKYILKLYKVSNRKDLDISTVNAAFLFSVKENKIDEIKISYGGVGPTVQRAFDVEKKMKGIEITEENFSKMGEELKKLYSPISDVRASKEYRSLVVGNLMKKLYVDYLKGTSHE